MNTMKLGTFLLLSSLALTGCDSPGFKSKVKTPANVAKGGEQAGQTETTSGDLQGGLLLRHK